MPKQNAHTERPPIVVVLGHVDHGKSTLLDYIRKTNIVEHEAGGITQHVAAYEAVHKGKKVTFIDTPGHAAFSAIRARGANVADIAILVVAADDGVKPQTIEALENIRAAKIPFVVGINKIDKPGANVEKTQAGLAEHGVYLEKLGGDVPWTAISAKAGTGVPDLLDLILIVAELENLTGDSSVPAEGYCLEAHRDPRRGIAATLIIRNGSLSAGQAALAGSAIAPVRIMENYAGRQIKSASFSSPVSLIGFDELPSVGEPFRAYRSKRDAEEARSKAASQKQATRAVQAPAEGEEHFALPIIVRADATGSLEAIRHETSRLGDQRAGISIILSGIGNISENDIKAAIASKPPAIVLGFDVGVDTVAQEHARQHGITIERFDIIYKLAERLESLLKEHAPKRLVEETLGQAKVLKVFSNRKDMHVLGGSVVSGNLMRGASVRVIRRSTIVGTGKIKNLQANKRDTNKVETGSEFGAQIESVFEISPGDIMECFAASMK